MSSKKLVLDLVNAKNQLPLELNINLANVMGRVLDPSKKAWISTTIVPMPSTFYEEAVEVEYDRVDLTKMFQSKDEGNNTVTLIPRVVGPYAGRLHDMVDWIAKELGLPLSKDDIVDADFSFLKEFEETNVPLLARDDSLLYHGQAAIRYTRRRLNLEEVVRTTELDAIRKPKLTVDGWERDKASVTAATWAVDFTEYYSSIRKHDLYPWSGNPTALRNLMSSLFGFTNWPVDSSQKMVDYPTDVVADANQEYDRVIIQDFVDRSNNKTRPYEGPAYFHYNIMDLDL